MGTEMVRPNGAMTVRDGFGETQTTAIVETASTAVAAREKAATEARYIVAMRSKRVLEQVRMDLLKECERTRFAMVARYKKPVGGGKFAEGFSIRFAEAAIRCMGNIYPESSIVFESDEMRIVRQSITDLQSNVTYSAELVLNKTVERKFLKDGQVPISERKNSKGETTFLVPATDDEIAMKQASAWSKFIRNGLRFVPGDFLDECEGAIADTLKKQDTQDPDSMKRYILDGFSKLGVTPTDIQAYLGHPLDRAFQPAEIKELREAFNAIKEGETTWADVIAAKDPKGSAGDALALGQAKHERLKREAEEQKAAASQANAGPTSTTQADEPPQMTEAQMQEADRRAEAATEQPKTGKPLQFGKKVQ